MTQDEISTIISGIAVIIGTVKSAIETSKQNGELSPEAEQALNNKIQEAFSSSPWWQPEIPPTPTDDNKTV